MDSNRLKKNADIMQLICLGTRQQIAKPSVAELELMSERVQFSTAVSDLGVHVDEWPSLVDHVAALCKACFRQLRVRSSQSM